MFFSLNVDNGWKLVASLLSKVDYMYVDSGKIQFVLWKNVCKQNEFVIKKNMGYNKLKQGSGGHEAGGRETLFTFRQRDSVLYIYGIKAGATSA